MTTRKKKCIGSSVHMMSLSRYNQMRKKFDPLLFASREYEDGHGVYCTICNADSSGRATMLKV